MSLTLIPQDVAADTVSRKLAANIGEGKYKLWFQSAKLSLDDHTLHVVVPNRFVAGWIDQNFHADLLRFAQHELGQSAQVAVEVDPSLRVATPHVPRKNTAHAPTRLDRPETTPPATRDPSARIPLRFSLDQFVAGPSNELAYTSACRMADDATSPMRVLFIHGSCGLGKTHLLQGLCARYATKNPKGRWLYTSAEQFTNQYIQAVRTNKLSEFRRKLRHLDLLAVDDVHFLSSKPSTQTEFQHTFDSIDMGGARIVMASDAPPKRIPEMADALTSRFMCGMVVRVDPPDPATRARIIHVLAERRGVRLMESAMEQLAAQPFQSVREIEGSLTKLAALASLTPTRQGHAEPVGHLLVGRLLDPRTAPTDRKPIRIEQIIRTVCREMEVERSQLVSRSRHRRVVLARAAIIHLARKLTTLSYPELAKALSRPNHSTMVTASQRIARQLRDHQALTPSDTTLADSVPKLLDLLHNAVRRDASDE